MNTELTVAASVPESSYNAKAADRAALTDQKQQKDGEKKKSWYKRIKLQQATYQRGCC